KYDFGRLHIEGMIHQCNDVGGDYYYFRPFQEKYVVFCLGDVMGKGISAAMVMAVVMGFFFEWGKKSPSPSVILEKLNKRLLRLWSEDSARFTTLFYAVFDEESSLLTYSSGGHGPALILRKNGTVEKISGEGLPIGILEGETWDENQVTLEKGDRVFVFTDGLTEARAQDGELFSLDRVIEILKQSQNHSCGQSIKKLRDAAVSFSGGEFSDDMAILAVEVVK
nr:serine/threonine-protein phosphatase [bacterium]